MAQRHTSLTLLLRSNPGREVQPTEHTRTKSALPCMHACCCRQALPCAQQRRRVVGRDPQRRLELGTTFRKAAQRHVDCTALHVPGQMGA